MKSHVVTVPIQFLAAFTHDSKMPNPLFYLPSHAKLMVQNLFHRITKRVYSSADTFHMGTTKENPLADLDKLTDIHTLVGKEFTLTTMRGAQSVTVLFCTGNVVTINRKPVEVLTFGDHGSVKMDQHGTAWNVDPRAPGYVTVDGELKTVKRTVFGLDQENYAPRSHTKAT